ncbi:MAG: hypothetical protein KBT70_13330 [Roseovarius sp.]|uniref:hypothetical protein n=1 Tax=Roseovarius sp. TaxID=1486281 RepID=UPI001B580C16|nr:hypothetical protein [Roseovarius sp.]MBQ0751171.1 hypothetical protein [Roseovarius sp.]MBQ0810683.1 hypothetical protein [Roseovarius sp.]
MSDPVTNVEIEDVLSSIRRLVSNGQAERVSAAQAAPRESGAPGAERLVLTPALRVDDRAAEVSEDRVWADTPEPDSADIPQDDSAPEGIEAEQDSTDADTSPEAPSELSAQAAEFEALVAGRDDQWEPDGTSDDAYAGDATASALNWSEDDGSEAEGDEAEIAPSADPDWDEADDQASERHVQDWQDADEAAARPTPAADADRGEGLLMDDAVLDEEALRDLVAEIVRQELQGALGERITRNVRKLVRREIHRALTSQDFD